LVIYMPNWLDWLKSLLPRGSVFAALPKA
jgi:hypothetical protein